MVEIGDTSIIIASIAIIVSFVGTFKISVKDRRRDREMHEKEWDERRQERKNRKKELRDARYIAIYSELFISYEKLEGAFMDFLRYITTSNTDMLRSTDKMEYSGPITFPVYDALKTQPVSFYQLEEASKLDVAYFRVNAVNNAVNYFSTSFDIDTAEEKYDAFHKQLLEAADVIYLAFESNTHVLEKIKKGTLPKKWCKFVDDRLEIKKYVERKGTIVKEEDSIIR
jgi:hypothetical protein